MRLRIYLNSCIMKTIMSLLCIIVALIGCNNPENAVVQSDVENGNLEVLYFHGKQRCITCNAIERLTNEVLSESFFKQLGSEEIVVRVIDISKEENETIADKYEVTWSSLILVKGDTIRNMTEVGFSYAKNSPDIFKEKLKIEIDELLK